MPPWPRLRRAVERAVAAVPRLRQRVVDAPLDLTLPHWARDPTFDLDYHVRRHALAGGHDLAELLREIAPTYETPFDRSRPLWEARVYEGLADGRAAIFFKLHHAVADGVGANAIFAAMTDWERRRRRAAPGARPAGRQGAMGAPARPRTPRRRCGRGSGRPRSRACSSGRACAPRHGAASVADRPRRSPCLRPSSRCCASTATRRSSTATRSDARGVSSVSTCPSRTCAASGTPSAAR